jgi:hypothetical protein
MYTAFDKGTLLSNNGRSMQWPVSLHTKRVLLCRFDLTGRSAVLFKACLGVLKSESQKKVNCFYGSEIVVKPKGIQPNSEVKRSSKMGKVRPVKAS